MKNETRVLKSALPLFLEGSNGKAVLVQHGYNGYPREMYEPARGIHAEGYTVAVPRLPGHATNAADFRKTDWRLWYNHVYNEYLNLQSRYESVSVVGLSLGAVLALLMAAEFTPEKIILLAPAMTVTKKLMYLTPILKYFIPRMTRKWEPGEGSDADRQFMADEYWSHYYTAQIAGLNKLIGMARRRLKDVVCPVYIMLSEKDSIVPLEAGDVIEHGVGGRVEKLVLKNSPHVFFEGPEKDIAVNKVIEWLKSD